jgi:phosphoserine aminotransferase
VIDCSFAHPVARHRLVACGPGLRRRAEEHRPAGLTLVFVRDDLLGHACRSARAPSTTRPWRQRLDVQHAAHLLDLHRRLVFQWLKAQREGAAAGVAAMEQRAIAKAGLLYGYLDGSEFY